MKFTDIDLMPFGRYKGKRLADIPDSYLLWLWEKKMGPTGLIEYLRDNLDSIRKNAGVR